MTASDPSKKLHSLLKRLRAEHADATLLAQSNPPLAIDPLTHELIYSFLLWEASTAQARPAADRLLRAVVDLNELRVCLPQEIADHLGERYPLALERAMRLRGSLLEIYRQRHAVCLDHLPAMGKREARSFLASLDGMPGFVAARVAVVALDAHAVPLDDRLRALLAGHDAIDPSLSLDDASAWLERQIRAQDARETAALFQAWSDAEGHPPKTEGRAVPSLHKSREPVLVQAPKPAPRPPRPAPRPARKPKPDGPP